MLRFLIFPVKETMIVAELRVSTLSCLVRHPGGWVRMELEAVVISSAILAHVSVVLVLPMALVIP